MNEYFATNKRGEFDLDFILEEYRRLRGEWVRHTVEMEDQPVSHSSPLWVVTSPSWEGKILPATYLHRSFNDQDWGLFRSGR